MFIKTNNKNCWINLSTCRSVETHQLDPNQPWRIVLSSAVILSNTEKQFVGRFETETEAEEAINAMWQAYRDGEKVWEVESFNSINPDERWTAERFNELLSSQEYSELYESRNQTERLSELGADLMNLVTENQWTLTHKFMKYYVGFYFGPKLVFGVNLQARRPRLCVWLPYDVLIDREDDWVSTDLLTHKHIQYYEASKCGVYKGVEVADIKIMLDFAYAWWSGGLE